MGTGHRDLVWGLRDGCACQAAMEIGLVSSQEGSHTRPDEDHCGSRAHQVRWSLLAPDAAFQSSE
jgi:hypothetical protein